MSTIDVGDFPIDPDVVDGTQLADILNRLKLAIYSNHSNTTRPADITEGGIWTKYTAPSTYQVLIFDGVTDAPLTVAGLAKGTSFANPFDGAVAYNTGALIWDAATETLLSAKYPITAGLAFNPGDWNANAKIEGTFLHLTGGAVSGPVSFAGAVDFAGLVKLSAVTPSRALGVNASGNIAASSTTVTELSYLSGTTSAVQTQLNAKQATITGAASTVVTADLNPSAVVTTTAAGKITSTTGVTVTELGYLDGVTSNIQTQLNGKADDAQAWPGVNTSGTDTSTAYPIGSIIGWQDFATTPPTPYLRSAAAPFVADNKTIYGTNHNAYASTRTGLPGTWRHVGAGKLQRTA